MATIAGCLANAERLKRVSDTPQLDTQVLLANCLGRDRTYLYTWPEKDLTASQQRDFEDALARREKGEPVAHILGCREFWSLPLQVNASTLIPRPDTECLVELALEHLTPGRGQRILDLGTGTGAIALALAKERPDCTVVAVDASAEAVRLAEANRERLQFGNVTITQSDWFSALSAVDFDMIVSNPPYIDADDQHLLEGDVRFEPQSALVAADQGMADLRHIIHTAAKTSECAFTLLLEHGWQQGEAVRALMNDSGYSSVVTHADLSGRERVTVGQWQL